MGVWPLFASLLMFFVFSPPGTLASRRGFTSVHEHFWDVPQVPFAHQSPESDRFHAYVVMIWVEIVSAYTIFGILVCTEDVRGDLGMLRNYVVGKISCRRSGLV